MGGSYSREAQVEIDLVNLDGDLKVSITSTELNDKMNWSRGSRLGGSVAIEM